MTGQILVLPAMLFVNSPLKTKITKSALLQYKSSLQRFPPQYLFYATRCPHSDCQHPSAHLPCPGPAQPVTGLNLRFLGILCAARPVPEASSPLSSLVV